MARTRSAPRRKTLDVQGQGGTHRLEIAVSTADLQALHKVASLTGETTLTAVLRDALKVYTWVVIEQQRNQAIIAEDRASGTRTELMPLLCVTALSSVHQSTSTRNARSDAE
jgi:hypothetical protein